MRRKGVIGMWRLRRGDMGCGDEGGEIRDVEMRGSVGL